MAFLSAARHSRPGCVVIAALASVFLFTEICVANAEPASARQSIEYQVKAAMLYNFTRFISWPDTTGPVLRLCVVGDDPFGTALTAIDGEPVDSRTVTVARGVDPGSLEHCQVVFVSRSAQRMLPELLAALADRPVVTIGEGPDFVAQGGTIGLVVVDGKVRFDINAEGLKQRGVRISSKLLRLARRVRSGETP